jgi:hypothetical protein
MTPNCITLSPRAVTRVLGATVCFLVLAHAAGQLTKYWGGYPTVYGLVPLFDLNAEQSVSTFFAAAQLMFAGLLLAVISVIKKRSGARYANQWVVLALAFVYMAVDEAAGIHEWLAYPVQDLLGNHASGLLYFAWVVPGMIVTGAFALWFLRFYLHLPVATRVPVLLAASLFIGGALGVELVEGRHVDMHGSDNLTFAMIVMVEEACELAGITLFIDALLEYIGTTFGEVAFAVKSA